MSHMETSFIVSGDTSIDAASFSSSQIAEDDESFSTESNVDVYDAGESTHLTPEALAFCVSYITNMIYVLRNLAISVIVIGFLSILLRSQMPSGQCPVVFYVIMGYWTWLSVLIIGGQLLHLYFYR